MATAIEITGPKPRDLNDEMPELLPTYHFQDLEMVNAYRGFNISNANINLQNIVTRNVDYPVRIRGGNRHVFEDVDFQRVLSDRRARLNAK